MFVKELGDIVNDVSKYFNSADPNDFEKNIELSQPYIKKWDYKLVPVSVTWVIEDLKELAKKQGSSILTRSESGENILDNEVLDHATARVDCLIDLLNGYSQSFTTLLAPIIENATDEDIIALAAYVLTANKPNVSTVNELKKMIKKTFNKVKGTSCKISLAYLLYICGDEKEYKDIVFNGTVLDIEFVKGMQSKFRSSYQKNGRNISEADHAMFIDIAMPGVGGFPISIDSTNPMHRRRVGVLGLLALDVVSDGKAFSSNSNKLWVRKQY